MGALIVSTFDELCDSSDTETGTRGGARILPASRALRILALVINSIGTRRGRRVDGLLERDFLRLDLFYLCL